MDNLSKKRELEKYKRGERNVGEKIRKKELEKVKEVNYIFFFFYFEIEIDISAIINQIVM